MRCGRSLPRLERPGRWRMPPGGPGGGGAWLRRPHRRRPGPPRSWRPCCCRWLRTGSRPRAWHPSRGRASVSLRSPIQFRQVAAISNASCPAGSGGLPGTLPDSAAPVCVYLTGTGMTVTALQSAQVVPSGTGGYLLEIGLTRAETGPFAALTLKLSGLPSPRDQLAVIIDGRVIDYPAVQSPIPGGTAQIAGFAPRAQAESLLSSLRNQ